MSLADLDLEDVLREFKMWLSEWGRSVRTLKTYLHFARHFLEEYGLDFNTVNVQRFLSRYEGNSRATAFYAIRALARYLESMGYRVDVKWDLIPRRWSDPRLMPLDRGQVERLVRAADSLEIKALILVMYDLALRISEAARLRWRDFTIDESTGVCWLDVRRAKGGEPRSYPLSPRSCQLLLRMRRYYEAIKSYDPDAPIFGTRDPDQLRLSIPFYGFMSSEAWIFPPRSVAAFNSILWIQPLGP